MKLIPKHRLYPVVLGVIVAGLAIWLMNQFEISVQWESGKPPLQSSPKDGSNGAIAPSTRRARHSPITNRVRVGDAMDVPERADRVQEPISMVRCRELLGDEAHDLSDDDVREVARHAEAMARILIVLARQDGRIH